jgi:hypothetical protein
VRRQDILTEPRRYAHDRACSKQNIAPGQLHELGQLPGTLTSSSRYRHGHGPRQHLLIPLELNQRTPFPAVLALVSLLGVTYSIVASLFVLL